MSEPSRPGRHRWLVVASPYLWLLTLFLVPFLVTLKIAFSPLVTGIPPYGPLTGVTADGALQLTLHTENFAYLLEDSLYGLAYLSSLRTALQTTLGCLLIGYPVAYAIARSQPRWRPVFLMLVVMPFWTSFLIRVYAWMGILKDNGLLNQVLEALGIIHTPLTIMNTPLAVTIVMIYAYLPFMLLPLYATLEKLDASLLEAASDLGAHPLVAFVKVTLPLSIPGILAGCLLVFIPAVGEYLIPTLVGSPGHQMIASVVFNEFFLNRDWPTASAVAVVIVLLLLVPMMLLQWARGRVAERAP